MATVVLQTVGAVIGGAIGGPVGAVLGRAAGGLAGNALDQQLFSKDQVVVGPRLENANILTSTEGTAIPFAYGRTRLSGQIIWATRFDEVVSKKKSSGKGGGGASTTTQTFSYFANFAVGICEGPISGIRRIWADEQELDLTTLEYRIYTGSDDQLPDPLIEAKQGSGNAPAYRGTAYVVFEDFPLEKYGNRIPQISFEVIRAIGALEKRIRSISLIPGATEYGYDTQMIESGGGEEEYNAYNRHTSLAITDWQASIDELQMVCPNLQSVSLIVTWYGTDLRAGECEVKPGVTHQLQTPWNVAGLGRPQAHLVTQIDGRAAFGGTPTDASVLRAIADLKARGLKVTLYPFVMMDIPQNNTLPWLTGPGQPVYPWRGDISCFPPPGEVSTVDKTSAARTQLDVFSARYQAMIVHYANLCAQAGGVDGFLIGSELRGLTRVRDDAGAFPFVETLINLAAQARTILGTGCRITYGADWSEYFGYQPTDGSGDVLYNLDSLWASPDVDAIGIDNYMPLSDWKNGGDPSFPEVKSVHDKEYLKANIASGEGYDWYYASPSDRNQNVRTEITDGQGEPWIFRYKDLVSWWSNPHHERLAGVKQTTATVWVPQSKPIYFTELGCPAIDAGSNQPNVFFDPKSDQSAIPYFSGGTRDDLIQRRFLDAHYEYWEEVVNNPVSSIYGEPMVDISQITPWAWDARPFPWFPANLNTWSDGENWHLGHWLTGRLGTCSVEELIGQILEDHAHPEASAVHCGILDGYSISQTVSTRQALEPLLGMFDIHVYERDGKLVFRDLSRIDKRLIEISDLVQEVDQPTISKRRVSETELPAEAIVHHTSVLSGYGQKGTKSRRIEGGSDRQITLQAPITLPEGAALAIADRRLQREWASRTELNFSLSAKHIDLAVGDVIGLAGDETGNWFVESAETGNRSDLTLRSVDEFYYVGFAGADEEIIPLVQDVFGPPSIVLMDLPLLPGNDSARIASHLAVSAIPWGHDYGVEISPSLENFEQRQVVNLRSTLAKIHAAPGNGFAGRWDHANSIQVTLMSGSLQSVERLPALNGANLLAVKSENGNFELLQFRQAQLQPDGSWILSELLRGQLGTEFEMNSGIAIGGTAAIIDESVTPITHTPAERGIELNWRIGRAGQATGAAEFAQITFTNNARSKKMLSPVHLKSEHLANGDIRYRWVRRGRIDADSWENPEIPLDANEELYQITVKNDAGDIRRETQTDTVEYIYSSSEISADLGAGPATFSIEVAQISDNALPGAPASLVDNIT